MPPAPAGAEVESIYRIQPGDLLDVKFFYNPELNEQVVVRSDGKISLQLITEVTAGGLTPTELTQRLSTAYAKEILEPKITVIVRTPVADKVYVDGEVNRAGMVTISGTITAVQSIAQAGGMKESANPKTVVVIRRGSDNEISTIHLNVEEIRKKGEGDVVLQPNDIVYVPRSSISDINTWIDLYIRKNVPLPIGLGYSIR
ncbi:hypothetical protein GMPD_27860 [Geomonas paludis]|uniref:Uncharacterized protein n=1 Tax=Geomonas paludis TaxID=2740185 RepID=A0A6V8MYY7_9BACT|nr:hypothetical protein GMPD_27860 [Geomonas paludis]